MKFIASTLAAACIAFPVAATAATFDRLIYEASGSGLVVPSALPGFDLEGSFFDASVGGLVLAVTGDAAVDSSLSVTDIASTLFVSDTGGTLLESDTVASTVTEILPPSGSTPTEDSFSMLFTDLTGDDAGLFDTGALVVFSFFEEAQIDGFIPSVTARVYSDLAPIPLPASLPLLGFALLGGALVARKKARQAG